MSNAIIVARIAVDILKKRADTRSNKAGSKEERV
jgi:hypothetical protein